MPLEKRQEQQPPKTQVIQRQPFSTEALTIKDAAIRAAAIDWERMQKESQAPWLVTTGVTYVSPPEGALTYTAANLVSSK